MSQLGRLQAAVLVGAWRERPTPPVLSPGELACILPLLLGSGAAGLAWWGLRQSPLASTDPGNALRQGYRVQSLRAALREDDTLRAIDTLRSAGTEPLLLKGWAVARSYPERGLRPYGDIDLLVRAGEFETALAALRGAPRLNTTVELHPGLEGLVGSDASELFGHSRLAGMGSFPVRVLGPEDQLRYLCLHMVKHGGRRPLQLVDIALLTETASPDFDWDYCLRGSESQVEWVGCGIGLAHLILGASLDAVPEAVRSRKVPDWVLRDVLQQWKNGMRRYVEYNAEEYLRTPGEVHRAVIERWPSAMEATVWSGAPLTGMPRLPLQLAEFLYRAAVFPAYALYRLARRRSAPLSPPDGRTDAVRVTPDHTILYAERPWDSP